MTIMLSVPQALGRWRRSARRSFAVVAVLVVASVAGAFVLPAGTAFTVITAGTMSLVAGFLASGTYCLGRVHALEGLRTGRADQPR